MSLDVKSNGLFGIRTQRILEGGIKRALKTNLVYFVPRGTLMRQPTIPRGQFLSFRHCSC